MSAADTKVDEALQILAAIGFPLAQKTPKMQRRLAEIMLAVAKMAPDTPWGQAAAWADKGSWTVRSRDVIKFLNEHYGEQISSGSYDDIRRKNLDFLVASRLVLSCPGKPAALTNDGTRDYAINPDAAGLLRRFGTDDWARIAQEFVNKHGVLTDLLDRKRVVQKLPVALPEGVTLEFTLGPHNELQKAVIEQFLPIFVPGAEVLYVGDADDKALLLNEPRLRELNFFKIGHERLPDVIAYDPRRQWLFLIEAVHSANPVTPLRHLLIEKSASGCKVPIVYVSAFQSRKKFAEWADEISWETEVWIADQPDHLIHFNGDKFLGPHMKKP